MIYFYSWNSTRDGSQTARAREMDLEECDAAATRRMGWTSFAPSATPKATMKAFVSSPARCGEGEVHYYFAMISRDV